MPIQEYRCKKCGTLNVKQQSFADEVAPKVRCTVCGGEAELVRHPVHFRIR